MFFGKLCNRPVRNIRLLTNVLNGLTNFFTKNNADIYISESTITFNYAVVVTLCSSASNVSSICADIMTLIFL